jgi:hypothetical protein
VKIVARASKPVFHKLLDSKYVDLLITGKVERPGGGSMRDEKRRLSSNASLVRGIRVNSRMLHFTSPRTMLFDM